MRDTAVAPVIAGGRFVGRVGALAVALGIGAAVVALPALAQADSRDSGGSGGSPQSSDSPADSGRVADRGPSRGAVRTERTAPQTAPEVPAEAGGQRGGTGARRGAATEAPDESAVPVAGPGASSSGGGVSRGAGAGAAGRVAGGLPDGSSSAVGASAAVAAPAPAPAAVASAEASAPVSGGPAPQAGEASLNIPNTAAVPAAPPAVSAGAGPLALSLPLPPPDGFTAVPPGIQKMDARTQATVRTVFNTLINWVSSLPVTATTTWLQGGLLMVRKSLFNQSAHVSAVQTVNSAEMVKGRIDVLDPEGDGWKVEVVESPAQGTVVLGASTQTEGRGKVAYTYTPGPQYSGSDRFVLKVSPTDWAYNVLQPFGALNARYYTVEVGSAAVSDHALGATAKDTLNTTLYLGNAGASVTVEKKGVFAPRYAATVTLSASSATRAFDWMDARGRDGSVSVQKMLTENWAVYAGKAAENGAKPLLMFKYRDTGAATGADSGAGLGAENVVFVDVDKVTRNSDGSFAFTGYLSAQVPAQNGRVDRSDFTGIKYEQAYQNFLTATGLKDCTSGSVCTTVAKVGTLGLTTLTPSVFVEDGGHDYPSAVNEASATQTYPGAMGPGTTDVNQGNGEAVSGNTGNPDIGATLTAMIPWGSNGSFITATNLAQDDDANNGIYLYTVNSPTGGGTSSAPTWTEPGIQLAGNGWDAAVNTMTTYTQIVTDANGNPIPQTFAGTVLPPDYTVTGSVLPGPTYNPSGGIGFQNYTLTGSASAAGTTPASFTGAIIGSTLTVTGVASGTINAGDFIVGGPASGTQIGSGISGTGGAGTYTVSPSQTWPAQTGFMTSASPGTNMQVYLATLPSYLDPATLVGGSVYGYSIPSAGVTITGYSGNAGTGELTTANYTVSAPTLAVQENLTIIVEEPSGVDDEYTPVSYNASGTISATGSSNFFAGSIDGSTLTVSDVSLGSVNIGDYITAGSSYPGQTQIQSAGSGSGGVGTYTVTPTQTWPTLNTDQMTSGQAGSALQLFLPAGMNPQQLIGAPVQDACLSAANCTSVAPGTTITSVNRYTGSAATGFNATFTVNTSNLTIGSFEVSAINQLNLDTQNLPGVDPASLVGASVSGAGIAPGTTIAAYSGTDPSTSIASYTINTGAVNQNVTQTFTITPLGNQIALDLADGVSPEDLLGATILGNGIASGTVITAYTGNSGSSAVYTLSANNTLVSATGPFQVTFGSNTLTLTVPNGVNPGSLIGQSITGTGVAPGTVIAGFVADSASPTGSYTFTVNNRINSPTPDITITTPDLYQTYTGLVVGLSDGSVQYWNGLGCSQTQSSGCTGAANEKGQANYGGGWTQLQASNGAGWGEDNPINTLVELPNNLGLAVGLGNGSIQLWNSTIMLDGTILPGFGAPSGCGTNSPASCWIQLQGTGWDSAANAMITSGQDGSLVVGLADGSVQRSTVDFFNGSLSSPDWANVSWTTLQVPGGESDGKPVGWGSGTAVNTLIPYDTTTFVGSISGTPVVANAGVISAPSYAGSLANSPELAAAGASCTTSYTSGSGVGCGGYVLTVQQAAGQPLRVGQTLYGGAGLVAGTTITAQISDGDGNLCSASCTTGGTGVYFVDTPQLVAPGTPMSASDGTGFVVGLSGGAVFQWIPGTSTPGNFNQLQDNGWSSVVNTMIPWRDGLVVGLNNGSVFYWSPSNNPVQSTGSYLNSNSSNALAYPGSTIATQGDQSKGWSELQGTGWNNAVTAMLPLGDGFAAGLTATSSSQNGTVEYFTGFGPASTTQAFGYGPGPDGPVVLTATNAWTEIAGSGDLTGNSPNGSIQQLIPLTVYTADPSGSGTVVQAQSLIAGLTNNGIYAWTGSTQNTTPSDVPNTSSAWQMVQASDAGSKPVLTGTQLGNAWSFVNGAGQGNNPAPPAPPSTFGDNVFGTPGQVGDPTPGTGDPVFGLTSNQAYCANNNSCSSSGDYFTFAFTYQPGNGGVIFSWPSDESSGIQADINLELAGYGYIFVPNGVWDKFHIDDYSMGVLLAAGGGPSLNFTLPSVNYSPPVDNIPIETKNEPIMGGLGGIVTVAAGVQLQVQAGAQITNDVPIELAGAEFIPGILLTWNVAGYQRNMAMTAAFTDSFTLASWSELVADVSDPSASASLTVTPSLTINWGYTIPDSVPLVGGDGLVNLGMGYSNPVQLGANVPNLLDPSLQLTLTTSGVLNFNAALLPGITSLLSWNDNITLYNYSGYIAQVAL